LATVALNNLPLTLTPSVAPQVIIH